MSHFCQYHPVDKTGGQNMYRILERNDDLQFYNFVRLCLVMTGSLARCLFLSPWLKSRRASLSENNNKSELGNINIFPFCYYKFIVFIVWGDNKF